MLFLHLLLRLCQHRTPRASSLVKCLHQRLLASRGSMCLHLDINIQRKLRNKAQRHRRLHTRLCSTSSNRSSSNRSIYNSSHNTSNSRSISNSRLRSNNNISNNTSNSLSTSNSRSISNSQLLISINSLRYSKMHLVQQRLQRPPLEKLRRAAACLVKYGVNR